jgi:Zn-dependent peptidase ImmA (M78 family)
VGRALQSPQGAPLVVMAKGAPYFQILTTLAHELVHIWKYDHLQCSIMDPEEF